MKKSRKGLWFLIIVVLAALAVPVANLVAGGPTGTAMTQAAVADPQLRKVATLLEPRCAHCHVPGVAAPFYASIPGARGLIERDVTLGLRYIDLARTLVPKDGAPPAEPVLARIEREVARGSMPPVPYLAMHWNARLGAADRDAVLGWVRDVRTRTYAPAGLSPEVAAAPVHPIPAKVDVDPRKASLGGRLYHDKRLSGDDTLSCASCHDLAKGGTDQAKVSTGIRGQKGGINAPTTFNALWQVRQFWDGRAATLEEQAGGPPLNPVEMGATWEQIVGKLNQDEALAAEFRQVYPDGFSARTITDAIAAFERTLVTPNAKFDRFLLGQAGVLSADEKRGWEVFQERGCVGCHAGRLLGGGSFERMGRHLDYFADRGNPTDADLGRFAVTKDEADRHAFKVPTLRNVARTAPYFHDGSAADLPAAVRAMAKYQHGATLADGDVTAVVRFLEALTGEYQGKPL